MARTIIALVFPEYDDRENVATAQEWKWGKLPDDTEATASIKDMAAFIDFFGDEECALMYDSKNAAAMLYVYKMLPECYPSHERAFRLLLRNLEDWRKNRVSVENEKYQLHQNVIRDEMRTEIAARMKVTPEDDYLMAVHIPDYLSRTWEVAEEGYTYSIESCQMSIKIAFDWLASHRHPTRKYNWNPKHGVNGHGAHAGHKGEMVSLLLCSKEHAAELLNFAIGEPMYDTLYCFDADYDRFMEYKAENKYANLQTEEQERNYHSFHLIDNLTIPNRVKKKLRILEQSVISEKK